MAVRLLIVDDDPMMLRATVRALRPTGWEIVTLDHADKVTPTDLANADVALIDWQPFGPTMVQKCQAAGVPFVVFSANPDLVPAGFRVVAKPFDSKELCERLQACAR